MYTKKKKGKNEKDILLSSIHTNTWTVEQIQKNRKKKWSARKSLPFAASTRFLIHIHIHTLTHIQNDNSFGPFSRRRVLKLQIECKKSSRGNDDDDNEKKRARTLI